MALCFIGSPVSQANPVNTLVNHNPKNVYDCLKDYVASNVKMLHGSGVEKILTYLEDRSKQEGCVRQDLLPLYVYMAISKQEYEMSLPLAAGWTLYLAASHFLDDAQDNDDTQLANASTAALGLANILLAQLQTDLDTLKDILDAFSRVVVLGANAQDNERSRGRIWSRVEYFQAIAGKAAAIIATGVWAGGRLATNDPQTLTILKEFGLAWGMAIQITDDYVDLKEDLSNGIFTLPIIEGLLQTTHPDHPQLVSLLHKTSLTPQEVQMVANILDNMGTITLCKRVVRVYQAQAAAAFDVIPELATYFSDYVTLVS